MLLFFSHSVGLKAFLTQLATSVFSQMPFFPPLCFGIYLNVLVRINNVCLCLVWCCNVLHITKPLLKPHIFRCDDCVSFLKHSQGVTRSHPQLFYINKNTYNVCYSRYKKVLSSMKVSSFIVSSPNSRFGLKDMSSGVSSFLSFLVKRKGGVLKASVLCQILQQTWRKVLFLWHV